MNQRLISEIGRTQRLDIINSLKRTKGMSVNELVEKMGMSYMGIKQHCLTLQRDGYLDTWRSPQKMGRPEMVYRLTRRSHDLFPIDSNEFTLELLRSMLGKLDMNEVGYLKIQHPSTRTSLEAPLAVKRPRWAVPTRRSPLPLVRVTSSWASTIAARGCCWRTGRTCEPVGLATRA